MQFAHIVSVLTEAGTMGSEDIWQAWQSCLGEGLSSEAMTRLQSQSVHVKARAKSMLVSQDDAGGRVFLVASGRLKAVKFSEAGQEVWLSEMGPGEIIGELSFLTNRPRTSTLIALTEVELLSLPERVFGELMDCDAKFARAIATILAERLVVTSGHLTDLRGSTVDLRLHSELVLLGTPIANDPERSLVGPEWTMGKLGERIHCTREAASRALTILERRGLAKRLEDGKSIIVNHPAEPNPDQTAH